MIVDIRKLDSVRELADEVIAELAISRELDRGDACVRAAEALGFRITVERSGIWYFASALSDDEDKRLARTYLQRGSKAAAAYEARLRVRRQCAANSAEDASIALLCKLMDPGVSIELADRAEFTKGDWDPESLAFWNEWSYWIWDACGECFGRDGFRVEVMEERWRK